MRGKINSKVFDLPELRNHTRVFRDRAATGKVLANMMKAYRKTESIVLEVLEILSDLHSQLRREDETKVKGK